MARVNIADRIDSSPIGALQVSTFAICLLCLIMDGYDVQEWGAADGVVTSVATDYTLAADQPVFRVRVRPMRATLRRPDGRTVALRKGLRCQARFLVGRRRITQLLLRRAGEWADPSQPIAH